MTKMLNAFPEKCSRGKRDNALRKLNIKKVVRRGAANFLGVW
jgi:hypothetical protein